MPGAGDALDDAHRGNPHFHAVSRRPQCQLLQSEPDGDIPGRVPGAVVGNPVGSLRNCRPGGGRNTSPSTDTLASPGVHRAGSHLRGDTTTRRHDPIVTRATGTRGSRGGHVRGRDCGRPARDRLTGHSGPAELVRGPDGRGVTILLDGHPASFVDLDDPFHLEFEYLELMAVVIDTLPPGRLAVTHIGGGGLTLARYLQAGRPGSPQLVLEPDAALTAQVRATLPLPAGHRIRIRPTDGETGVRQLAPASADVLVLDAYREGRVPAGLTTAEFLTELVRVLRPPTGVVLLNLADQPGLRYVARVAAGLRLWLPHLAVTAAHDVLKGRRFGNAVLVGAALPLPLADIARRLARGSFRAAIAPVADAPGFPPRGVAGGGVPFTRQDAHRSPLPPVPGRWLRGGGGGRGGGAGATAAGSRG